MQCDFYGHINSAGKKDGEIELIVCCGHINSAGKMLPEELFERKAAVNLSSFIKCGSGHVYKGVVRVGSVGANPPST